MLQGSTRMSWTELFDTIGGLGALFSVSKKDCRSEFSILEEELYCPVMSGSNNLAPTRIPLFTHSVRYNGVKVFMHRVSAMFAVLPQE